MKKFIFIFVFLFSVSTLNANPIRKPNKKAQVPQPVNMQQFGNTINNTQYQLFLQQQEYIRQQNRLQYQFILEKQRLFYMNSLYGNYWMYGY